MKKLIAILVLSALVAACSGGGGNAVPPAVPTGSATGTVLDGLILNGTVTAYDYSSGAKGAVLGTATTNSTTGYYSLSIQAESRPILLEITGGYYNEEMDPTTNIPLDAGDKMQAVVNYTTGAAISTSITAYTTAAAGLAAYEIKKGIAVATAIDDANHRFSNLVGLDIIKTVPLEITDTANASATLTPGLQYGFLAGGISMWVNNNYPSTSAALRKPYISIKFIQLMYQDIVSDGLLDGMGLDGNGNQVQLSFGTIPLSPTIYRQGIGVSMLQIAQHANNKTGLGASKVLPFGETYAGSTDLMWAGVPTVPISSPSVVITSPAPNGWMRGAVNVTATIQDYAGLSSAELFVDTKSVGIVTTNIASFTVPLNTAAYGDGPHTIAVKATNVSALTTTAAVVAQVDNTPPTVTVNNVVTSFNPNTGVVTCSITGSVSDTVSGPLANITAAWNATPASSVTAPLTNNTYSLAFTVGGTGAVAYSTGPLSVTVLDNAGNATTVSRTLTATTGCGGCRPPSYASCTLQ